MVRSRAGRLVIVLLWSVAVTLLLATRWETTIQDAMISTIVAMVVGYALIRLFVIWLK